MVKMGMVEECLKETFIYLEKMGSEGEGLNVAAQYSTVDTQTGSELQTACCNNRELHV